MGYDVHITRAADWIDSDTDPIMLDEWDSLIQHDPEMQRDNEAIAHQDGVPDLSYHNPGLAVWLAYSKNEQGQNLAWFDYQDGRIVVKNPDDEILSKMKRIAAVLNARVIGDEGEEY